MVNGGHGVLGALARRSSRASLRTTAAHPPHAYLIGHLHRGMNEALAYKFGAATLPGGYLYGLDRLTAYTEVDDKVSRIVGKFQRRQLAPYLAELEERVFRPANVLGSALTEGNPWAREALDVFETVLDCVDELLENLSLAVDFDRLADDGLSDEADDAAVAVYTQLARGWLSSEAATRRIRDITDLLRDQREAYQG
jgi:hypothetical protein